MISKYEFQFSVGFHAVTKLAITAAAVLTFSQYVVQLFGQTVPGLFWPYFREIGFAFVILGAFVFAVSWFEKQDHITNQKTTQLFPLIFSVMRLKLTVCEQNLRIMM